MPKYFILFDAIVNKIVFLISVLGCSFLEYRNNIDISIFILYSVTLLNLFMSSNSFCSDFLKVFYVQDCHLQIEIVLILPF